MKDFRQQPGTAVFAIAKAGAVGALVLAVILPAAIRGQSPPDVSPPPPPAENFLRLTEAEFLARLPDRERAMVESAANPRAKVEALIQVSELRLAAIAARLDVRAASVRDELLLFDASLRATDNRLRAPESKVAPRDKLYKRFERCLTRQRSFLRAIVNELPANDVPTGNAVMAVVERLRVSALNSALDATVLVPPEEP